MSAAEQLLASYLQQKGQETAVGDWLLINQVRIDAFAQGAAERAALLMHPHAAQASQHLVSQLLRQGKTQTEPVNSVAP